MAQKWPAGTFNSVLTDFWMARITVYDGDSEYSDDIFIRGAATEEQAMNEARYWVIRYWHEDEDLCIPEPGLGEDYWTEGGGGCRIIQLVSVRKITTFDELMENLFIVDYREREVNCAGNSKSVP